ncbi:MAG: helix-turn-helix domain-containing protein [Pyrinomonadaceae bacterium]
MSLTLGEKLQQAREARGITISEVAEQTRISSLYLECIENNDYRTLPGGIFNKGFVKSYARYVGIDEQEALQDYSRLITEQQGTQTDEPKTYKPEVLTDDRSSSSSLITIIFAVIILGLMTWGILALVNYLQSEQNPLTANNSNTANANRPNVNTNPLETNTSQTTPSFNEIKVELKALGEKVSVEATIDGKKISKEIQSDAVEPYTAQQSVKLRYYKGFADRVELKLNGKSIKSPPAPAKGNGVEFEINKNNAAQIYQSGQILTGEANNANTNVRP